MGRPGASHQSAASGEFGLYQESPRRHHLAPVCPRVPRRAKSVSPAPCSTTPLRHPQSPHAPHGQRATGSERRRRSPDAPSITTTSCRALDCTSFSRSAARNRQHQERGRPLLTGSGAGAKRSCLGYRGEGRKHRRRGQARRGGGEYAPPSSPRNWASETSPTAVSCARSPRYPRPQSPASSPRGAAPAMAPPPPSSNPNHLSGKAGERSRVRSY